MKFLLVLLSGVLVMATTALNPASKKKILVDVGHGQKFYRDPADKISTDLVSTERLAYMTGELAKNAAAHNGELGYWKTPITAEALSKVKLLFIHSPAGRYTPGECTAIRQFVETGGSLFIAMEEDYWSTLAQVNVNEIVKPLGITFGNDNPDTTSGGHSIVGSVTKKQYSIPSHGARLVTGGTPFAYGNATGSKPIGVFAQVKKGKVIAMGEGMVSLYMTSWQGVNDYACAGFMDEVIGWLLS